MKKYVSLFSFVALFFIGMQSSSAQTTEKQQSPEAIAKQKTAELDKLLDLSGKQQGAIFDVLLDAEQTKKELQQDNVPKERKQIGEESIANNITANFEKILTPLQYATYKRSLIKN
jgi:hypothetical protein